MPPFTPNGSAAPAPSSRLRGSTADGHDFVARALANGAALAVDRDRPGGQRPGGAGRRLPGGAAAAGDVVAGAAVGRSGGGGRQQRQDDHQGRPRRVPGFERRVYVSPGSYNSQLGVPLSILECPDDVEVALIEVAASEPGEMAGWRPCCDPIGWSSPTSVAAGSPTSPIGPLRRGDGLIASSVAADGWVMMGEPSESICRRRWPAAGAW